MILGDLDRHVNHFTGCRATRGAICLQSEGLQRVPQPGPQAIEVKPFLPGLYMADDSHGVLPTHLILMVSGVVNNLAKAIPNMGPLIGMAIAIEAVRRSRS